MGKEYISEREGISILIFFLGGPSLILSTGAEAGKDLWISIIFATFLGLLMSLVYIKILSSFPGKNLFEISEILFGRFLGKTVSLLYAWFAFHIASLIFSNFTFFIVTVSLPETQPLLIVIFQAILCILGLKLGIEGIGRFSNLVLIPVLLFVALAILLMIPQFDLDNFLPVLENGFQPIFKGTFSFFAFPFAETVILMGLFNCIKGNKSVSRVYMISIILGGIILLLTQIAEVAIMGIDSYTRHYFPAYTAVSSISIGDFIDRIEIIVGLLFSVAGLVKVSVCMLVACKGISKVFSFTDYRFLVTPMVILNIAFMFISNKDIMQATSWTKNAWRYYAFPFQVIIPVIMLIFITFKKKYKNI